MILIDKYTLKVAESVLFFTDYKIPDRDDIRHYFKLKGYVDNNSNEFIDKVIHVCKLLTQ